MVESLKERFHTDNPELKCDCDSLKVGYDFLTLRMKDAIHMPFKGSFSLFFEIYDAGIVSPLPSIGYTIFIREVANHFRMVTLKDL